jgi:hypothetical protein
MRLGMTSKRHRSTRAPKIDHKRRNAERGRRFIDRARDEERRERKARNSPEAPCRCKD